METTIEVPKAFSVRDDNEFLAFKHLMARLNPLLRVRQVGMGLHVNTGYTVFWGLVSLEDQEVTRGEFDEALREAGLDFEHHVAQASTMRPSPERSSRHRAPCTHGRCAVSPKCEEPSQQMKCCEECCRIHGADGTRSVPATLLVPRRARPRAIQ